MKKWVDYTNLPTKARKRIYHIISLEFSHTKLENHMKAPEIVNQMDWIQHWPAQFSDPNSQIEGRMIYPKVQKYCLMGLKNSFTDFHIDFGGSSVWYHVVSGEKVFLLIPPTTLNLEIYLKWTSSKNQSSTFLADLVEAAICVVVKKGNTFFIPSGWIHAVQTREDSFVFGGNFLHSFNIKMQLKIFELEVKQKIKPKFSFPFFEETNWFAAYNLSYRICQANSNMNSNLINEWEREGIIALIDWLSSIKSLFPLFLFSKPGGHGKAQFIIDTIMSYLRNLPLPSENIYSSLELETVSPVFPEIYTCEICMTQDEKKWISCDYCGDWWHIFCLGLDNIDDLEILYCKICKPKLNHLKLRNFYESIIDSNKFKAILDLNQIEAKNSENSFKLNKKSIDSSVETSPNKRHKNI